MKLRLVVYSILLSISLSRCIPYKQIDPTLAPYVESLTEYTLSICPSFKLPNQYIISLGDLKDKSYIGVCYSSPFRKEIVLDKDYWTKSNYDDKISLLVHESAHCTLDLDHVDDPNHYMNSYYTQLRTEVVKEQYKKDVLERCNK